MKRIPPDPAPPPANSGAEEWQRPSPFAILFFAGSTVRHVVRGLQAAALPWLALFLTVRDDPGQMRSFVVFLWIFAGLIVVAVATYAVVQWLCFRFLIARDRLFVRRGFIRKSTLDMPFDRVQGMNVERSLVDRIVGLVTVTLDTSGSAQAEGSLPSVRTEVAQRLRTQVARRRKDADRIGAEEGAGGGGNRAGASRAEKEDPDSGGLEGRSPGAEAGANGSNRWGRTLLGLGPADMVRIGLANRNFIVMAAIFGLVADLLSPGPGLEPVLELLASGVESAAGTFAELGAFLQLALVVVVVFLLLAAAFVQTTTAAFLRHHNFTLWHDGSAIGGGTFRSRAGLLTQREIVVRTPRIQQLTVNQDLVLRCFGKFRMRALPAATLVAQGGRSPGALNLAEVLEVPVLGGRSAEELGRLAFGREGRGIAVLPGDGRFRRVSPWYIRALAMRIWLVGGAALGFALAEWGPPGPAGDGWVAQWLTWWLALAPVAALLGWQLWRRRGYLHDDDGLASRRGFLGTTVEACLMRKAQAAVVKRSPLQRRRGLATLIVRLACGKIVLPYLEAGRAQELHDYILYRVESSQRRWH